MARRKSSETKVNMSEDKQQKKETIIFGKGLDVGTGNFCCAYNKDGEVTTKLIRDAFVVIEADKHKLKMLEDRGEDYILKDDKVYLIGEKAKDYANIFGNRYPLRRPLAKGVLNPDEKDSHFVVREILKSLLGQPQVDNEKVYFSVPAEPLDATFNQIFHENKFIAILEGLGFEGIPINEAKAIIYSNAADYDYSGIAISFGAGMCNLCLSYEGDTSDLEFSLTKPGKYPNKKESFGCGDYIDINSALAVNREIHEIIDIKESSDLDLFNIDDEVMGAIAIYYRNLIKYVIANIKNGIENLPNIPKFKQPIPILLSGGTSLAKGFVELFEQELKRIKFPVEISEVKRVDDPLRAVATGALIGAMSEYEGD